MTVLLNICTCSQENLISAPNSSGYSVSIELHVIKLKLNMSNESWPWPQQGKCSFFRFLPKFTMIGMFGLIGKTLYKCKNTANCFKDGEEMAAVFFFSCSHLDMETQPVLLNMSKEEFLLMMRCDISQGPLFMKAFFCSVFDGRQTEQGPPFPVSQGSQRKKIQPCGSFVFMCCQVILLVLQQGSDCMVPPFMTKTLRRYFPLLWRPPEKHPKHPSSWVYLKRKVAWTYHSSSRY